VDAYEGNQESESSRGRGNVLQGDCNQATTLSSDEVTFPQSGELFVETSLYEKEGGNVGTRIAALEGRILERDQMFISPMSSTLHSMTRNATKHRIFVFPPSSKGFDNLYCLQVGYGSSCFIKRQCNVTHHSGKLTLKPGMIVVAKSATKVFPEPNMHRTNVTTEVLEEWLRSKRTITTLLMHTKYTQRQTWVLPKAL
jgi:hypothetical protein